MFAQWLINFIVSKSNESFFSKVIFHIFIFIRKTYLKFNENALVKYKLNDHVIILPLRHDLPIIKRTFAYYDSAIGRIPQLLSQKYPSFQAVDIGANVGDTVITIKSFLDIPVLCIEADEFYFKLLVENTRSLKNVYCENSFIGDNAGNAMKLISYHGSARLTTSSNDSKKTEFKSLSKIIQSHSNFNNVKFLKIDTDGFDCNIIRSNINYLTDNKPVVYFEYDPYFLKLFNDDGLSVFKSLQAAGYYTMLIYDNTGRFMISTNVNEIKLLEQLHIYYSGRKGGMYMDICIFHQNDNDIAEKCVNSELKFWQNTINKSL